MIFTAQKLPPKPSQAKNFEGVANDCGSPACGGFNPASRRIAARREDFH
jgi:hypothetical protein